jgi:hypothetical protein
LVTLGFLWLHVGLASAAFACLIAGRFVAAALLAIADAAGLAYFFAPAAAGFRILKSQHIAVAGRCCRRTASVYGARLQAGGS